MPPCGYRPNAIENICWFLSDNLEYFIELHSGNGLTVDEALAAETDEIAKIMRGDRGGRWAKVVVLLNSEFYMQLRERRPTNWSDVKAIGDSIISEIGMELAALTPDVEQ